MDPLIEYLFGTGDGHTTSWSSTADLDLNGDGRLDAVRLDFDGDGLADDAMWDSDGDGIADRAVLDHSDPTARSDYSDSGRGLWDLPTGRQDEAVPAPGRQPSRESDREPSIERHDLDDDGRIDVEVHVDAGGRVLMRVDSDGDGTLDAVVTDSDGDGYADSTHGSTPRDEPR